MVIKPIFEGIKELFSSVESKPTPKLPGVCLSTWPLFITLKGWLMDENSAKLAPKACQTQTGSGQERDSTDDGPQPAPSSFLKRDLVIETSIEKSIEAFFL